MTTIVDRIIEQTPAALAEAEADAAPVTLPDGCAWRKPYRHFMVEVTRKHEFGLYTYRWLVTGPGHDGQAISTGGGPVTDLTTAVWAAWVCVDGLVGPDDDWPQRRAAIEAATEGQAVVPCET